MKGEFKIKNRLIILGVGIVVLVFITCIAFSFSLYNLKSEIDSISKENKNFLMSVDFARSAQLDIKRQVQAHKNLLIRGHDKAEFDKNFAQFKKYETDAMNDFASLKKILNKNDIELTAIDNVTKGFVENIGRYEAAYKSFSDKDPLSYRTVDNQLKGIDLRLDEELEGVVSRIIANNEKRLKEAEMRSNSNFNINLIIVFLIFILVLGGMGGGVWFTIRGIVSRLTEALNSLASTSTQIAATMDEHERIATQQSSAVNQTTTTMDELRASSRQSYEQAEATSTGSQRALTETEQGNKNMAEMVHGMLSLKEKVSAISEHILNLSGLTSQIGSITKLMTDFANETKMLAMNAAVEAVRAGEHGKGFSLLAVEIRKLAEESKNSAGNINSLVDNIKKQTDTTVMVTEEGLRMVDEEMGLADQTSNSFRNIGSSIGHAFESITQITHNTKQQSTAINQVVEAMTSLNNGARETASGIIQTKTGVKRLNEISLNIKEML